MACALAYSRCLISLLSITSTRWAPFGGQPDPNQFFVFAFDDDDLQSAFNEGHHDNLSLEPQAFEKK